MSVYHLLQNNPQAPELWTDLSVNSIVATNGMEYAFASGTVVANAVNVGHGLVGKITDSGVIAGATSRAIITVTNTSVVATSVILISADARTATPNVAPLTVSVRPLAGTFEIGVFNNDAAATVAAPVYHYQIINVA